jgi:hypothetical protein
MAFTATVALVTGSEAVSAGLVLAAVAEVGTAVTAVGAVTGNKDMMKVGGAMAIVGIGGGLVAGAVEGAGAAAGAGMAAGETGAMDMGIGGSGVLNAAAETGAMDMGVGGAGVLGDAADLMSTQGLTQATADAASVAGDTAATGAMDSGIGGSGIIDNAAGTSTADTIAQGTADAGIETPSYADSVSKGLDTAGDGVTQNVANAGNSAATDVATPADAGGPPSTQVTKTLTNDEMIDPSKAVAKDASTPVGQDMGTTTAQKEAAAKEGSKVGSESASSGKIGARAFGDKMKVVGDWAKSNPALAAAALNIGGSVIKGMFQPNMNEIYNRRLDIEERQQALQERKYNNASTAPGVGRSSVMGGVGGPAPVAVSNGLINGARLS